MTAAKRYEATAANEPAAEMQRLIAIVNRRKQEFTPDEWMDYRAEHIDCAPDDDGQRHASSWSRQVPLAEALKGASQPMPTVGRWKDLDGQDRALFYANEIHTVFGEPESLKTWIVLHCAVQEIKLGHHVFYFDMESNEHAVVARLKALGVPDENIARFFHYFRPDGPITTAVWLCWERLVDRLRPTLVVLDGVSEAFATQDKDIHGTTDTAKWYRLFARRFLVGPVGDYPGPAVVEIDHVVKSKDDRGRWAIGSQHKMAGIKGAAYRIDNVAPLHRGGKGHSRILCEKDSAGGVTWMRVRKERLVGFLYIDATDATGQVDAVIESPSDGAAEDHVRREEPLVGTQKFRDLMHAVSKFVKNNPECSAKRVKGGVAGTDAHKELALEELVAEGWIKDVGRAHHRYVHIKDFDPLRVEPVKGSDQA